MPAPKSEATPSFRMFVGSSEQRRASGIQKEEERILGRALRAEKLFHITQEAVDSCGEASYMREFSVPDWRTANEHDERFLETTGFANFGLRTESTDTDPGINIVSHIHPDDLQHYRDSFSKETYLAKIKQCLPDEAAEQITRLMQQIDETHRFLETAPPYALETFKRTGDLTLYDRQLKNILNSNHIVGHTFDSMGEFRIDRGKGNFQWVSIRETAYIQEDGVITISGSIRDATEIRRYRELDKKIRAELERKALQDDLTELPNRRAFHDAIEKLKVSHGSAAVFSIDLNDLNKLNDIYHHPGGDAVLVRVARELEMLTGKRIPEDDVYRLGGDEFAIILNNVPQDAITALNHRIMQTFSYDHQREVHSAIAALSVGAVYVPEGPSDIRDHAYELADTALFYAKRSCDFRDDEVNHLKWKLSNAQVYSPELHGSVEHAVQHYKTMKESSKKRT